MTGPQIIYGMLAGELIHIDNAVRGESCGCTCRSCGRNLVARKGEVLSHFFAHVADDLNCNPTPESLIHAYAKQQVAKLRNLQMDGFDVHARYQSNDGDTHEMFWRHRPKYLMHVEQSDVESTRFSGVIPDVLFYTDCGWIAVEVFYRHAVPTEKVQKLSELGLATIEIDLSDLPINASAVAIDRALTQAERWAWLNNQCIAREEYSLKQKLSYSRKIIIPEKPNPTPNFNSVRMPAKMMRDAASKSCWNQANQLILTLRQLAPSKRLELVRPLGREMRLALHCIQIGISPIDLPASLMQTVQGQRVFGVHPILWQTGLFAKFCMSGRSFTAKQAAFWVRSVFPGLEGVSFTADSANSFNEYSLATHNFFNHLGAQGLQEVIKGARPWEATFQPVDSNKARVLERLTALPW
jgi:hypothetical protein